MHVVSLKKVKIIFGIMSFFLVGSLALAGYLYYEKYTKASATNRTQANAGQSDATESLVQRVGKIIVLPKDEAPTEATITDLSKLRGQPFFANAKLGYKVLIYTKNKKAVLYDPFENRVVEIGPVAFPSSNNL